MSIREKIIASFLAVIVFLIIALASVFVFHISTVTEYKKISDSLILENTLTSSVDDLMEAYNAFSVAPTNFERKGTYESTRASLQNIFIQLDVAIVDEDSKIAYQGLKNIILLILKDLDTAQSYLNNGDIVNAGNLYDEAVRKKIYVETNVTALVLEEIQSLHEIQEKIEGKYQQQFFLVLTWLSLVVLGVLIYSVIFAQGITRPIKALSAVSEKVSAGDYSERISLELVERQDEVGILAVSFNSMLDTLNEKITQVETAHATILANQNDIKERNNELEKFNSMVINRELKMIELKEENRKLRESLTHTT